MPLLRSYAGRFVVSLEQSKRIVVVSNSTAYRTSSHRHHAGLADAGQIAPSSTGGGLCDWWPRLLDNDADHSALLFV